ncbi:MAG TPA: Uma2 family endonuclease [Polyangiales bacterium]|nr:Uma2 family endonuclease [Polyangiales bacterium]
MTTPPPKLATYADLEALGEDVRAEVMAGEVVFSPSPLPAHSAVQRSISGLIGVPFHDDDGRGGPGGWWILVEMDVALGKHDIVRPDLSGWRRERVPRLADTRPVDVAPDWVCEVISPSNAAYDRVRKRALYARSGIPFYWLIDPRERVLEALALRDGAWVEVSVYDDNASARIAPFEAIKLEVGRLFLPREADAR